MLPAREGGGQTRPGAWVGEVTDQAGLSGWPPGMRLLVRKERPHPGAQLRFTDHEGLRLTAFVTNSTTGSLPELELRHRRRARRENRVRAAKDTGLRNLPFHSFSAHRIWTAIVALAMDLTAWTQALACTATPHVDGNRKHYGYDCSRSRHDWLAMPAGPPTPLGSQPVDRSRSHRFHPPRGPLNSANRPYESGKAHPPGLWNLAAHPLFGQLPLPEQQNNHPKHRPDRSTQITKDRG